ncbi:hypothetical protein BN59_03709 [Legionella massiliensis]|uniref:Uncharacterized protein n=1 Tax=Legionella massiliensis TaxID=1034943 RepID=A0A078L2H3_9GAMM|nr:hypothetical protein [Legionella massiliensis]CDZ79391.1 hypothetical protein BN59_03709 [Legionella massiliensis]CEE15129.1 hypothetical protein BN1094_03709 [Legionella massiliensis]
MTLNKDDKLCEFPPNCLQFRALCLGFYSDLRMPSAAEAHREILNCAYAKKPKWSHAVVKFTANRLGPKFLAIENEGHSFAIFKEAYEQVCHLIRQGHQLPAIEEPVWCIPPQSKEIATTQLAKIRQLLGVV